MSCCREINPGANNSRMPERRGLIMLEIMVFFVSLAIWIVSRLEKRTLDEFGLSRQRRVVAGMQLMIIDC
jgi:hypothetical protein